MFKMLEKIPLEFVVNIHEVRRNWNYFQVIQKHVHRLRKKCCMVLNFFTRVHFCTNGLFLNKYSIIHISLKKIIQSYVLL
jgi:hypothetical protein